MTGTDRPPEVPPPRARERVPSRVLVHTGDGKGKTSAAMGVVMRAVARGLACLRGAVREGRSMADRRRRPPPGQLGVDWWSIGDGFTWDSDDIDARRRSRRDAWRAAREVILAGEHNSSCSTRSPTR